MIMKRNRVLFYIVVLFSRAEIFVKRFARFLRTASIACLIAATVLVGSLSAWAVELDVMSFNIRFDKGTDGTNNWNYTPQEGDPGGYPRKEKVFATIGNYDPDILGVQEAFDNQVADLQAQFPGYQFVGGQASLDPENMPGEHAGIFFRSSRFMLLDHGTFWYSGTPDVPGTFFPQAAGSSSTRSSTWAKLYDKQENATIAVMDNHWYSNSAAARVLTAPLVRQKIKDLLGDLPLIVMGDFNNADTNVLVLDEEIEILVGQQDPTGFQLLDTYRELNPSPNPGVQGTTHGNWTGLTNKARKDLIFHTNKYVVSAAAIDHTSCSVVYPLVCNDEFPDTPNGTWPSDHFPVRATLELSKAKSVLPTAETTPSSHGSESVDDPAIWVDASDPANSFIIGADKTTGNGRLELYNIINPSGTANTSLITTVGSAKLNNVDLRYGFNLDGQSVDLVVASDRTSDKLAVFRVDPVGRTLVDVTGSTQTVIDPYGLTLYQAAGGSLYAFASDRDGNQVRQFELVDDGSGNVDAQLVRTITMNGLVEGMVADDEKGIVYIGEEDTGIFRFDASPATGDLTAAAGTVVDLVANGNLTADIEGLALYNDGHGHGFLIASSQGDSTYVAYQREGDNKFLSKFAIGDNTALGIDGTSDTDGLDVTAAAFGTAFPKGFLIVQDGDNPGGGDNFKVVPWESVATVIPGAVAGDMNGDGHVNLADVAPFIQALTNRSAYQQAYPLLNADAVGDLDGNGLLDLGDVALLTAAIAQTSQAASSATAVPEPASWALFALPTASLLGMRCHREKTP